MTLAGPGTYIPNVNVEIVDTIKAMIVKVGQALRLRALKRFTDRTGAARSAGEEYLWKEEGAFIPDVDEEVVSVVTATVLTDRLALALR